MQNQAGLRAIAVTSRLPPADVRPAGLNSNVPPGPTPPSCTSWSAHVFPPAITTTRGAPQKRRAPIGPLSPRDRRRPRPRPRRRRPVHRRGPSCATRDCGTSTAHFSTCPWTRRHVSRSAGTGMPRTRETEPSVTYRRRTSKCVDPRPRVAAARGSDPLPHPRPRHGTFTGPPSAVSVSISSDYEVGLA